MIDPAIGIASAAEFARLVEPYLQKMLSLASRLGGDAIGEDVVQDALLNAWRKRGQFDPTRGSLSGWLMAITADQARKSWSRRLSSVFRLPEDPAPPEPEDRLDVERSLHQLSTRQRLAVDCFYFVQLSVAETAAVMRCSEGTVKSTLSDARAKLRPALEVRE